MELPPTEGRLIITPHPMLLDGQRNIAADLQPGERLCAFLHRHVIDLDAGDWTVTIGGRPVPRHLWPQVYPKHGQVIELRGAVGKSAIGLVATLALTYFTFGFGAATVGMWGAGAVAGAWGGIAAAGVFVAGSLLVNKVLTPKAAKISSDAQTVYSLGSGRNQARPYEPLGLLLGTMRIAPDLASNPYTWYEGDEQYLAMTLTPGINVDHVEDIYNGDALLSSYEGVQVWFNGFPGMANQTIPLYSNADVVDGATLIDTSSDPKHTASGWVERTSSAATVRLMVGIEYQLFDKTTKGKDKDNSETIEIQYRTTGATAWQTFGSYPVTSRSQKTHRTTYGKEVEAGQYDVRVRTAGRNTDGSGATAVFTWTTLTSVQQDTASYAGIPRIGIKMQANGQLNGAPDELRTIAHSAPIPVWNGTAWVTQESSNPGAQILAYARGITDPDGTRIAGMGLSADMIDLAALQGFTLHCAAHAYTFNTWITDTRSHSDVLDAIALAGMGQITWAGGKLSVVWAAEDQPLSGVVNMATIKKGQFQVDYTLANAADGIEYTYLDATTWETTTLRVPAPGVDTMLNPAQVTGEGITTEAHAAVMARWHLAQSLYQYKSIGYSTDLEHLSYRRMSVLALTHDMTQWGYGGRVMAAVRSGNVVTLTLDEPVPAPSSGIAYIGLRIPGERVYRVFAVQPFTGSSKVITLTGNWPGDAALPGSAEGNPAWDTLWVYDFKQTPGYRVRVTGIQPESDLKGAAVTAVAEGPEFWTYVLTGRYIAPGNQSSLQTRPIASALKITERQVVQGDTVYTELEASFAITGPVGNTVVLADLDGNGELEQVTQTTTRAASFRIPQAGTYTVVVRPYSPDGVAGIAASVVYTTSGADAPPVPVDWFEIEEQSGGVRRYLWGYYDETIQSPDQAGVEIRYVAGNVVQPAWDEMIALGDAAGGNAAGYHAATFEAVIPASGEWTFVCRAVNTSGALSDDGYILHKTLGKNLGEQLDDTNGNITQEIIDRFAADEAEAQQRITAINQLTQELQQQTSTLNAAISQEVQDRQDAIAEQVQALLDEKTERVAAITAEQDARQSADESLAYSISQISAGTGTQFDSFDIWYFDTDAEGWNGTVSGGYLNPGAAVALSPTGLDVPASAYRYLKMRVQRVGAPVWLGQFGWNNSTVWDSATLAEPAWDNNGIATIDLDEIDWAENTLIDQIRIQLGQAVDADNYYLFDWVAVGRPTPGASVALVQAETQARIAGDAAEASQRNTLAVQLRGDYTGGDVAGVTQGLIYSERIARVAADEAFAQEVESLQVDLQGKASADALNQLTVRVTETEDGLEAMGESVFSLEAQLDGEFTGDEDWNTGDEDVYAGSQTIYTVIADGDQALARQIGSLQTDYGSFKATVNTQVSAISDRVSAQGTQLTSIEAELDGKASAEAVQILTARVEDTEEGLTSASQAITNLQNDVAGKASAQAVAALQTQVTQNGSDISAMSTSLNAVSASVAGKADASVVQTLSATVSTQGGQITTLNAQYFLSVNANGYIGGMKIGNNGTVVKAQFLTDQFVIVAPSGGKRMEYSDGNWRAYDENGTKRYQAGIFD